MNAAFPLTSPYAGRSTSRSDGGWGGRATHSQPNPLKKNRNNFCEISLETRNDVEYILSSNIREATHSHSRRHPGDGRTSLYRDTRQYRERGVTSCASRILPPVSARPPCNHTSGCRGALPPWRQGRKDNSRGTGQCAGVDCYENVPRC